MKTISYEWLKEQPATTPIEVNDVGDIIFTPIQPIKVGDSIVVQVVNGALKAGQYSLLNKGNPNGDYASKLIIEKGGVVCAKMTVSTPSSIAGGIQSITFQFID